MFLVEDRKHGRKVALKILRPEVAAAVGVERFKREIEVVARLQHPNIVPVYDSGEAGQMMGFTMPFIDGHSLQDRFDDNQSSFSMQEVIDIARDVGTALTYAHDQGVVHRDIKPANILLAGDRAVVADFGIAWVADATGSERLTGSGTAIGTPWYLSPEQASGEPEIDGRSDTYSLGCVVYQLLTGEPPYTGPNVRSILAKHLTGEVPDATALRPEVPPYLAAAVRRAMAKAPEDRFASSAECARALAPPLAPVIDTGMSGASASQVGKSIAVLPFTNMSADRENDYFSDGITEEIINALAQVPGLHVAARTSSFAFKGKDQNVKQIGRMLDVATVLEGSVRQAGSRLRITAQLVNVSNGYHLWSQRYDREVHDVFAIQDEIALAITETLKVKLMGKRSARVVKAGTVDLQAYMPYLKGRHCWNNRSADQLKKAIQHFEQAIAVDSRYALAYAGLADSYSLLGWYRHLSSADAYDKVKWAAEKAVEIDNGLAEAYTSLGYAKFLYDWDWAGAESDFKRAIECNPVYPTARHWYAELLMAVGRLDEAREQMNVGHTLDPMSLSIGIGVGWVSYFAGRYDEALEQYLHVLEMDSGFDILPWFLGPAYVANGMYASAIALYKDWLERSGGHAGHLAHLGYAYAAAGHTEDALRTLGELEDRCKTEAVPPDYMALIHTGLGQGQGQGHEDQAIEYLQQAFDERCWNLVYLNVEPAYAPLRSDPRFCSLVDALRLPKSE